MFFVSPGDHTRLYAIGEFASTPMEIREEAFHRLGVPQPGCLTDFLPNSGEVPLCVEVGSGWKADLC